jgi:hypothetical protein
LKKFLLITVVLLVSKIGFTQTIPDITVSVDHEKPLIDCLGEIESQYPVKFFYIDDWLAPYTVLEKHNGSLLRDVLTDLLKDSGIGVRLMYNYAVIFSKDPTQQLAYQSLLRTAVAEKRAIEKIRVGTRRNTQHNKQVSFSGIVKSELAEVPLTDVLILVDNVPQPNSDAQGKFSTRMTAGPHVVVFQLSNFKQKIVDLEIYEDGAADIVLEENPTVLEEIEISDQAIVNRSIGHTNLKMTDIKRAPTFLGEVDIIKQVQSQPGVTTVGEVATGFNVRGGGVDQNLVLYDGVPVLNTSHALGFFTAFNSDVVQNVSFYRGGIPAEYGGRVSSVLDITSKEGNSLQWKGGGGIGIISSYLTVGGPIKKETTTIIGSVRTSYSNWMLNTIQSNYQDIRSSSLSFYDASLKLAHRFNKTSKITFSGYTSHDGFSLTNDTVYSTRNIAASVRFDKTLTGILFGSASLSFGKYAYKVSEPEPQTAFDIGYDITHPSLKFDFNYNGEHKLSFGLHNTFYAMHPGWMRPGTDESNSASITVPRENSLESAVYFSDEFELSDKFQINAGLRFSVYNRVGPGTVYSYRPGVTREFRNREDSTVYSNNKIMKTYSGLEPRLSVQYTLQTNASIKLGYNRMFQYLHLVTNTAAVTPLDIWQSSNAYFKPQIADQISGGYYRSMKENMFEAFAEVFYKSVHNILDFKDGSQLIMNKNIETALINGYGKAYGVEFSITKVKGRLSGSFNYTHARSFRKTTGALASETINKGEFYPSNYDQPNVANLSWRYGISRRIFFSGNATYHTGRPMSLPVGGYSINRIPIQNFTERNQYRIPDYHRVDIALIVEGNHRLKKFWDGTWVLSFYNAYARKNAYSVFFKDDGNGHLIPYKLSVIGTVIPSLSYSFKF